MAIDFGSLLSDDQKRNILEQRIQQFAAEAYQHSLNRDVAKKVGNEANLLQAEEVLKTLEAAIIVHHEELNKLPRAE